ncbi:MAG TPA: rod shape-determining protein MreC, partial [Candidatus Limnocylindria bacterium]|nr:rod shape-determining protein MreC [Candidatus Limnocylindria bacterium]
MASFGRARRTQSGVLRPFALLVVVSLLLLGLRNTDAVRGSSTFLTQLLVPVQQVLANVGVAGDRFASAIAQIDQLRDDNTRLQTENDRLTLENVRLREQAIAGQQAERLLALQRTVPFESVPAPVIARDPTGVLHSIVLGLGTDDGVKAGHVVLSDQGLVGRVSEVGTNYSKVLLVTDSSSVVSALVQGSRATGIVRGQFGDSLIMDWLLQTEPVKVGDVVITAGLGIGEELRSLYPKGLVIGTIAQVKTAEAAAYNRAIVTPAVDLRRLEHVLVVKTN